MIYKIIIIFAVLQFSGCASIGKQFNFHNKPKIVQNDTTQKDIFKLYGSPFRIGYDNGNLQWAYGYYHMGLFSETITKDLVIIFNKNKTVKSYNYNSSDEFDKMKMSID